MLAVALFAAAAVASDSGTGGCPAGTFEVGIQQEDTGTEIVTHHLCQEYQHSGNGLVGGTGWKVKYYSPVGASPEIKAKALEMLKSQARLQGAHYAEQVDLNRYNFVIGIAASTSKLVDLTSRVWFDQLHNGHYSAEHDTQAAYDNLKGRSFDDLGCHSNGAMICLAALENGDVVAKDVTLYGPQVTTESLALWNQLMLDGKIRSLKIEVNQGDPIPPVSLLFSPTTTPDQMALLAAPLLFSSEKTAATIRNLAPSASVETFACGKLPTLNCHDMAVYSSHGSLEPQVSSRKAVPGTRLLGKNLTEPPPPPSH